MKKQSVKGVQITLEFNAWKRLASYKNKHTTIENRLFLKKLLSDAVNQALDIWEKSK